MIDKKMFLETVHKIESEMRTTHTQLTREAIAPYTKDMDLSAEQEELLFQYLQEKKSGHKQETEAIVDEASTESEEESLPRSMFFQMYLEDIKSIPAYTREEEEKLYSQLCSGQTAAIKPLSELWLARVLALAKQFPVPEKELPDLIQEGNIGVFMALEQLLSCGRAVGAKTFIKGAAKNAMHSYLADTAERNEMEESMLLKASLVYEAQKYLTEEFHRSPTMTELSQYTKISIEELEDILAIAKEKR